MSPLLATVLPRLGICRHFPRAMVFIPVKVFGLGFQHLYTLQEITRMKDLVYHTANNTITGRLYRASLELLHIELGSFLPLHCISFSIFGILVTPSLIKSTDIKLNPPRQDDCYLLPALQSMISEMEELLAVNRCWLFLKALFLSDIVNGSGTEILPAAWNGERIICPQRSGNWPNQSRPPPSAWAIWKTYLRKRFLGRDLKLRSPMGPWVTWDQDWPWYFCPKASALFHHDRGLWTRHPAVQIHSVRPTFSLEGDRGHGPS
jgi:hypothetical protein